MLKYKIYKLLEKGSHSSKYNLYVDYFIIGLILFNVISIAILTMQSDNESLVRFFIVSEIIASVIFSIEYLLRLYISDLTHPSKSRLRSVLKFVFSFYGLVDLLAIFPFYLFLFTRMNLKSLEVLRLSRLFRLLKLNKYNSSMIVIWDVVKAKRSELGTILFVIVFVLALSSFLMYHVEREAQPDVFPNVLSTLWWAVITLTTIGYGDVTPVTGWGKLISGIIAVLSIGIVALPTGIISFGFLERVKKEKQVCPHCKKEI